MIRHMVFFGQIAVMNDLITQDQLNECLLAQKEARKRGFDMAVGEILMSKGYITEDKRKQILRAQRYAVERGEGKVLGEMHIRAGLLREEDLKQALGVQEHIYKKLGVVAQVGGILFDRGVLDEKGLARWERTREELRIKGDEDVEVMDEIPESPMIRGAAAPGGLKVDHARFDLEVGKKSGKLQVALVRVTGDVTPASYPSLDRCLKDRVKEGVLRLVLDVVNVGYIDGSCVNLLVEFLRELRAKGGDLRISNIDKSARNTMDLLGLTSFVRIYDSDMRAVNSFKYF